MNFLKVSRTPILWKSIELFSLQFLVGLFTSISVQGSMALRQQLMKSVPPKNCPEIIFKVS